MPYTWTSTPAKGKIFTHKEFDKTRVIKKDTGTPGKMIDYSFNVGEIRGPQTEPENRTELHHQKCLVQPEKRYLREQNC